MAICMMIRLSSSRKASGTTRRDEWASRLPANPASVQPTAKAATLPRTTFTPSARAATSSSRIISQLRPTGLAAKRIAAQAQSAATVAATVKMSASVRAVQPPMDMLGTRGSPIGPRVRPYQALATTRNIWLKAMVIRLRKSLRTRRQGSASTVPAAPAAAPDAAKASGHGVPSRMVSSADV